MILTINILGIAKVSAGDIVQDEMNGEFSVLYYNPIGQTFTAEDARIQSIGFYLDNFTSIYSTSNVFSYALYEGVGFGGHLLGVSHFTLEDGFVGYANADFSFATLNVGQKYSIGLITLDYDWGVAFNSPFWASGDPFPGKTDYAGGEMILSGTLFPLNDLRFRITTVPEPSSGLLFAFGVYPMFRRLICSRFRRHSSAVVANLSPCPSGLK